MERWKIKWDQKRWWKNKMGVKWDDENKMGMKWNDVKQNKTIQSKLR
jgi:hypothetical protein